MVRFGLAAFVVMQATGVVFAGSLSESFATNPLGAGASSRFSYDAAAQAVVADYDSSQPTAMLTFPLGAAINQNMAFSFSTTFTIRSISNFDHVTPTSADDPLPYEGTAQLSFGLINTTTTGTNRTDGLAGNAFDTVSADYFPTRNAFGNPEFESTVIESADGSPMYQKTDFPSAANASLASFLKTGVPITATVAYDPATHIITATATASQLTDDATAGTTFVSQQNLDATSVAYDSDAFQGFNVDAFSLNLWDDSSAISAGYDAPLTANVAFSGFSVNWSAAAPEPASLGILGVGAVALAGRRRGRWGRDLSV